MPTVTIDQITVTVDPGTTIMEAAAQVGSTIPSLCFLKEIEPPVSCFVCVVKVAGRPGLVPSCSTVVTDGMKVESATDEVRTARRRALELLLSDHGGDCEAPCRRICPANLDIPEMARRIAAADQKGAAQTVLASIPFGGVLGHICPAPCEKGCRRGHIDGTVTIRELHRIAGMWAAQSPPEATAPASRTTSVAIVGAGPAGLTAAYYLARCGHRCTVFDENESPGGAPARTIAAETLPPEVLAQEIGAIVRTGVKLELQHRIEHPARLLEHVDAVVLAPGTLSPAQVAHLGLRGSSRGIAVNPGSFATSIPGLFACGGAVMPGKLAVRAVGQGRGAAEEVDAVLGGRTQVQRSFDCRLQLVTQQELTELAETDIASTVLAPDTGDTSGCTELRMAAGRCLACDCGAKQACELRRLAAQLGVEQRRYRSGRRKSVHRTRYPSGLVHEPGKCILCGRCTGSTAAANIRPGLALCGRGFDTIVAAPLSAPFDMAMGRALKHCVQICPTGALWLSNQKELP